MDTKEEQFLQDAVRLSTEIIHFFKDKKEFNNRRLMTALAVTYCALAKGTGVSLHTAMELVMAIYKNTEIADGEV